MIEKDDVVASLLDLLQNVDSEAVLESRASFSER